MTERNRRMSAESIAAAAAVVTALIALAVGIWENVQERRHARLSATPMLEYVIELRTNPADSMPGMAIHIVNDGVGPAIIDSIRIRLRDSSVDGATGSERFRTWEEAAPALAAAGLRSTGHAEFNGATVMGIGRERELASFAPTGGIAESGERFRKFLADLTIVIDYRSIYGDEFEAVLGS